jgi:hypothetical protein
MVKNIYLIERGRNMYNKYYYDPEVDEYDDDWDDEIYND